MRVLVTGATGLIGREVGKFLVQNGHEVRVLSRDPKKAKLPFPCEVRAWAGGEREIEPSLLEGIEGIIHLSVDTIGGGGGQALARSASRERRPRPGEGQERTGGRGAARAEPRD